MKINLANLANLKLPYQLVPYYIRNYLSRFVTLPEELPPAFSGKKISVKPSVIITHDVDTKWGFENGILNLMKIERSLGIRSTFFLVANSSQYRLNRQIINYIVDNDFEIGSHDLIHDGRLPYLSDDEIFYRLSTSKEILQQMGSNKIVSFRAPWLVSSIKTIPALIKAGYHIDSSLFMTSQPFPLTLSSDSLFEFPLTVFQDYYLLHKQKLTPTQIFQYFLTSFTRIFEANGIVLFNLHADKYDFSGYSAYYPLLIKKIINAVGNETVITLSDALELLDKR